LTFKQDLQLLYYTRLLLDLSLICKL